jgi:hypothetical protein
MDAQPFPFRSTSPRKYLGAGIDVNDSMNLSANVTSWKLGLVDSHSPSRK